MKNLGDDSERVVGWSVDVIFASSFFSVLIEFRVTEGIQRVSTTEVQY